MKPVTFFEVSDLTQNLDESKSPDSYNIPVKLIKLIPCNMPVALTDIFNESLKTGICLTYLTWLTLHQFTTAILDGQSQTTGQYPSYPIIRKSFNELCIRAYDFLILHNIIYEH